MPRGVCWSCASRTRGDRPGILRVAADILARDVSSGRLVAETSRGANRNPEGLPEKVVIAKDAKSACVEPVHIPSALAASRSAALCFQPRSTHTPLRALHFCH